MAHQIKRRGPIRLRAKRIQEERRTYQIEYARAYNARKKLLRKVGYDRPFEDFSQEEIECQCPC